MRPARVAVESARSTANLKSTLFGIAILVIACANAPKVWAAGLVNGIAWEDRDIHVCFENPGFATPAEIGKIRASVVKQWEDNSGVHLSGWGKCSGKTGGIRILLGRTGKPLDMTPKCSGDVWPRTCALGRRLDGMRAGMILNLAWDHPDWVAVHEFGHALGFAHDQNSPNTPSWCKEEPQGSDPDYFIGSWDPYSVMNYCNPDWNGKGELSQGDLKALHSLYGKPKRLNLRISSGAITPWYSTVTSAIDVGRFRVGDFDGDKKDDLFVVNAKGGWRYSAAAATEWRDLNQTNGGTIDSLLLGDFNGDGKTDVLAAGGGRWMISKGGMNDWVEVNRSDISVKQLLVGDFNGDGSDDVFTSSKGLWRVSYSASSKWDDIKHSDVPVSELALGDFNGDGRADVLRSAKAVWDVSFGGRADWVRFAKSQAPLSDLLLGDFTGDGRTDVLTSSKGGWRLVDAALPLEKREWRLVNLSEVPVSRLVAGDFDGDAKPDVLTRF